MIDRATLLKAWSLLDRQEKRNAKVVLGVMMVAALASASMVASIFPFLTVLSDPAMIHEVPALDRLYRMGGFTSDYGFLIALGLATIAILVAGSAILFFETWAILRYTSMRVHSISRRLLATYLARPYEYFLNQHSGRMSTAILAEVNTVVQGYLQPAAKLVSALLTMLAILAVLIAAEPVVATVTLATFAGIYLVILEVSRRPVRRFGQRRVIANEGRFRIVGEALGGIKDVKLLGREGAYLDRYSTPSLEIARIKVAVGLLQQTPRIAIQLVAFAGIIVMCLLLLDPEGFGSREALGGLLPVIGLLAFAGQRLMPVIQQAYASINSMQAGAAAVERLHDDIVEARGARIDRSMPAPLGLKERLELEGVTYSYPNAARAGLDDVSVSIRAGERIGIVGASGAGKTTLADVILGLLAPQAGRIRADGTEITPQTLRAWHRTVGYVPQDIYLVDASLSENIALGMRVDEIDEAQVERAARIAQLHDFAMTELPEGYATRVGERGVRLSGGQRQRIGIARALYHDADLIVFDEATSALDNLTEREVMASIAALPGDKTILMIAHRLSTVKVCDRILVMAGGRVEGIGPWDELVARNPAFRSLADAA